MKTRATAIFSDSFPLNKFFLFNWICKCVRGELRSLHHARAPLEADEGTDSDDGWLRKREKLLLVRAACGMSVCLLRRWLSIDGGLSSWICRRIFRVGCGTQWPTTLSKALFILLFCQSQLNQSSSNPNRFLNQLKCNPPHTFLIKASCIRIPIFFLFLPSESSSKMVSALVRPSAAASQRIPSITELPRLWAVSRNRYRF